MKPKKKVNPNLLPNRDNQLFLWVKGKFVPVPNQQLITSKNHQNFLITCVLGDWSPFLTWEELEKRMADLERDYPGETKKNFFFQVVERL